MTTRRVNNVDYVKINEIKICMHDGTHNSDLAMELAIERLAAAMRFDCEM